MNLRVFVLIGAAIPLLVFFAEARSPAQIKELLQSICPKDTIVKVAYLKDGTPANFAPHTNNANVYVVSSEDGIVRKVNTVKGNLMMVNITADGKRVLYWERNTSRTYVVNWDGSNERVVVSKGMLLEYWRDRSNGTDWAIIGDGGQYRINIDNPSSKVTLSPYECGGLGSGLSDDGTRIIVYHNGWGTAEVGSTQIQRGSGGCQASMRPGPIAQWSCNESGHGNVFVNNPNGTVAFKICIGTDVSTGEGARFTQHPNYFSFMDASSKDGIARARPVNPILLRISDNVRIGIEDDIPPDTWCGDVDAVFLPAAFSMASGRLSRPLSAGLSLGRAFASYSINGRLLDTRSKGETQVCGVVINRLCDTRPTILKTVRIDR